MAPYKINISYDGTDFYGYQRQLEKRTVQGEIESALRKIGWAERTIRSSGRTDAGVHADAQVADFNLDWKHSKSDLKNAINTYLPQDIAVIAIQQVMDKEFHPRFSARSRQYRYQIYVNDHQLPILERYYWKIWPLPEISWMRSSAKILLGKHDFSRFGRPYESNGRTERMIYQVNWIKDQKRPAKLFLKIEANSFLYHMVRRIAFVLIQAGQGKVGNEEITNALNGIDSLPPGIAPAKGLFLEKINY